MHLILQTPRLYLRRFTPDDAALLQALNCDPEVIKYVHEPVMDTVEKASQVLQDIILPQYHLYNMGRWAVHLKENNAFVGWCGLKTIDTIIDLGYRFHKHNWGKGYATESAMHVLEYGFRVLQLPVINAHAHVENTASQHVLQKIGMQYIKDDVVDGCPVKTFVAVRSLP
jgi:[ribosomal protein S5]-alanine N-acetyltransferase